jgi:hypothetical protein
MPITGLDISSLCSMRSAKAALIFFMMLQIAGPARDEPLIFAGSFALTFFQCFGFAADKKTMPGKADKPFQPQTKCVFVPCPPLLYRHWLAPCPHRKKTTNGRKSSAVRATFCAAASKMFFRIREMTRARYRSPCGKYEISCVFVAELS